MDPAAVSASPAGRRRLDFFEMPLREDIQKILKSLPREDDTDLTPGPDIVNLRQAVRELQQAVVVIAEAVDARPEGK